MLWLKHNLGMIWQRICNDCTYLWHSVPVNQSSLSRPSWRRTAQQTSWARPTWRWSTSMQCCRKTPSSPPWNTPGATWWTTIPSSRLPPGGRSSSTSSSTSCSACQDSSSSLCPSCRNTRSNRFVWGFGCLDYSFFKSKTSFLLTNRLSVHVCVCVCRTGLKPGRNSGDVSRCCCLTTSVSSFLWSVGLTTSPSSSTSPMTGTPCHAGQWEYNRTHLPWTHPTIVFTIWYQIKRPSSPALLLQAVHPGSVLWLCCRWRHLALLPASRAASPQGLQIHPQSPPRIHREYNMH